MPEEVEEHFSVGAIRTSPVRVRPRVGVISPVGGVDLEMKPPAVRAKES